jgi:hypothetical protein
MSYFERYVQGDHEAVWAELVSLGPSVREPAIFDDANAVARETMRRVADNINAIVGRLQGHGYDFARYPDGSLIPFNFGPLAHPHGELRKQIVDLENLVGTVPLSLKAFWETVGAVSLVGCHSLGWPQYTDPLVVEPPEVCISVYQEWLADAEEFGTANIEPFIAPISPDVFHKDNVSGGAPYGLHLPNAAVDVELRNQSRQMTFVSYLRFSLLEWGGFPGLASLNSEIISSQNREGIDVKWILNLKDDLIPF